MSSIKHRFEQACAAGDCETVRQLVEVEHVGPDLRVDCMYVPITLASYYGHLAVVRLLTTYGVPVDRVVQGTSVLREASKQGWVDIVDYCIELGVNLNKQGDGQSTSLMLACLYGRVDVVDRLIAAGCDINITDGGGCTALPYAARGGNVEIVDRLVINGADLHCYSNWTGLSALHEACKYGHTEVVDRLLSLGAAVNLQNYIGKTALMYACTTDKLPIMKLLLEHGADATIVANDGQTAFDLTRHLPELTELLKTHCPSLNQVE